MFHRHKWETIHTVYVSPVLVLGMKVKNVYGEELQHMLTPHTYVSLRCTGCGDLKEKEFRGKVEPVVWTMNVMETRKES